MWRHPRRLCLDNAAALRSVIIIQHVSSFCKIVLRFFHKKNAFCLFTTTEVLFYCLLCTFYFTEKSCKAVGFLQINAEIHLFSIFEIHSPVCCKRLHYAIFSLLAGLYSIIPFKFRKPNQVRFEIFVKESCILLSIKRKWIPFNGKHLKKFAEPP